jgi:hypothetical protein
VAKWITTKAACEAVGGVEPTMVSADDSGRDLLRRRDAIAAIRALPAPAPVGEEELATKIGVAIESVRRGCAQKDITYTDMAMIQGRAALSVVREVTAKGTPSNSRPPRWMTFAPPAPPR